MYKKVEPIPDFPTMEKRSLQFWSENDAFNKLREKNKGKPKWSFLDGPITANNPMGVHHAWGRSLKDMYQRYYSMNGRELRFQNGFDCQGLWVEVEVEKELGFKTKDDIVAYGMDKFVEKCKERVRKFSAIQTEQSIRLGYWMDWSNSYYTMSDENNYTIWAFLKKCHQRGFLYRGYDVMPWCPRCGVGLSQMEMHEGYLKVKDPSVVVKFPLKNRDKEALLVWTTTPWTLTSNVAAAVNPEMTYFKIRQNDWIYYAGAANWDNDRTRDSEGNRTGLKKLSELVGKKGEWENLGSVSGKELVGLTYEGPFDEFPAQSAMGGYPHTDEERTDRNGKTCHRVIEWDQVTGTEGTGIVHIAPGCGKEDYELGQKLGLVNIAPLDERGVYIKGFGFLEGKEAPKAASEIIKYLDQKGVLIGREDYPHAYPHCWRCKTPVLFRLVDEWYIKMDWRDEIKKVVDDIKWIPDFGRDRELDWLNNMRDWMISKKRYWGLALPIWVCEKCDEFEVISGHEELKKRAISGWDKFEGHSPHRPWIDEVQIKCAKCGSPAKRIPDVGNPWLDAGIVPFSTMGYNTKRDYWKEWFPADLVLECFPGQFRNWFYAMLAMGTMMEGVAPFKTLLGHALVKDEYGQDMHKSLGNAIEFNEAAEKIGAEIMRYLFASQNPVSNLNFPDIHRRQASKKRYLDDEIRRKLLTFWNCYSFYIQYANIDNVKPGQYKIPLHERSQLDQWIISRLQNLIQSAHECFENYQIHQFMIKWENFIEEELSNWYLRRSRRRFWKNESDADKCSAYATLYEVLHNCTRLLAPILPFLSEDIYQNLVRSCDDKAAVSVHLLDYPVCDKSLIRQELETDIGTVIRYKNIGLSLRNKENLKVRQPLGKIIIKPENRDEKAALAKSDLVAMILEELNVKRIEIIEDEAHLVKAKLKPNFAKLGPKVGELMPKIAQKIPTLDPRVVRDALNKGEMKIEIDGRETALTAEDIEFVYEGPQGLSFIHDGGAFVALDIVVSPELFREGAARDFIRHVQNLRKERGINIEDRIRLKYHAEAESAKAIKEWTEYIKAETLTVEFIETSDSDKPKGVEIKLGSEKVAFDLEKAAGY